MITNESKKMLKDMSGDEIKAILNTKPTDLEWHDGRVWIKNKENHFADCTVFRQKPKKLSVNDLYKAVYDYYDGSTPDSGILELIKQTEGYTP